jgi:hypothetical protein
MAVKNWASKVGFGSTLALLASLSPIHSAVAQTNLIQRGVEAQPDAAYEAAQRWFEALPEPDRRAIQDALVWTGDHNGVSDGNFGKRTRDAISAFAIRAKKPAGGMLDDAGKAALLAAGEKARAAVRFALVTDQRTGIRLGVPQALMPKPRPLGSGAVWEAPDGSAALSTDVPGETDLSPLFARLIAQFPAGRPAYKLLRPDFLVVAGENSGRTIYHRYARGLLNGQPALRGFILTYPSNAKAKFDPVAVAIANSFEPFPSTTAAAPPAAVAPAGPAPRPQLTAPASAVSTGVLAGPGLVMTSYRACLTPLVGGHPAAVRQRDETTGLTLLDVPGLNGPPLRIGSSSGTTDVLVLAFPPAPRAGSAATNARPDLQVSTGLVLDGDGKPRIVAPLQQPAGAAILARNGRLLGFAMLPEKGTLQLVAGIVPQSTYHLAMAERLLPSGAEARAGTGKTAGEVLASIRAAIVPVTCSAPP